eukprot:1883365-Prymnesium_polylepis.2
MAYNPYSCTRRLLYLDDSAPHALLRGSELHNTQGRPRTIPRVGHGAPQYPQPCLVESTASCGAPQDDVPQARVAHQV